MDPYMVDAGKTENVSTAKEDTPEDFAAALGDLLLDGFELILPFK
jgi:hypothetical protein